MLALQIQKNNYNMDIHQLSFDKFLHSHRPTRSFRIGNRLRRFINKCRSQLIELTNYNFQCKEFYTEYICTFTKYFFFVTLVTAIILSIAQSIWLNTLSVVCTHYESFWTDLMFLKTTETLKLAMKF